VDIKFVINVSVLAVGAYKKYSPSCLGHLFSIGNGLPLVSFVLVGTAQFLCTAMIIYWVLGVGPSDVNLNM